MGYPLISHVFFPDLRPSETVEDRLTEDYYAARLAGLAANCASTVAGISVSFSGDSAAWARFKR